MRREQNESVGKLLRELQEPRPGGQDCIPWLGETLIKEKLVQICARGEIAVNLRGMEYLQAREGEDEDTAWKRMRGKLGTGKHLDETYVRLPQAVPHAEGVESVIPASPDDHLPFGTGVGPNSTTATEQPRTSDISVGALFGGSGKVSELSTVGATSALNLLGKVESWGIGTGTQVQDIRLKIAALTGAQLHELLKKLPEGITYELSLNKEGK